MSSYANNARSPKPFLSLSLSLSLSLFLSSNSVLVFPLTNFRLRSGFEILGDSAGEAFLVPALATSPPTELVSEASFDPYVNSYPILFLRFPLHLSFLFFNFGFLFGLIYIYIYIFFFFYCCERFQADKTDAEDQPPAKRRLSSAVVKVLNPSQF
jgi:hypothetical protein